MRGLVESYQLTEPGGPSSSQSTEKGESGRKRGGRR